MSGPRVTSGKGSVQNYATPAAFIAAVERRFGPIAFDLAAEASNAKHARWFGPGGEAPDSLAEPWHRLPGLLFLNPPFADIAPWAKKCASESARGAQVALLVPASVGSNWFRDHAAPHADVYLLNGRIAFNPARPKWGYPKDCLIALYRGGPPAIRFWDWKRDALTQSWTPSAPL